MSVYMFHGPFSLVAGIGSWVQLLMAVSKRCNLIARVCHPDG